MKKRDRNNCLFYYLIMKILTIIALIGSILSPIKSDRYKNSFNDTGSSSFNSFVQVTYEYYCEEPSYTVGLSAGVISGETQVPLIYSIKLNIKLRDPVESAYIKLNFTSPLGTSPYWDIPALCENATIGYVDDNDLYIYLYNTDYASIYIVYTYEQVMKRYGYQYIGQINALDPMSPEWIEQGYTYCDLLSVTLSSATLSTSPDYSSQLNSIMTYTDGIENYLSQILTKTTDISSYVNTINTNISSIKTTISTISTNLSNIQKYDRFAQNLMESYEYRITNIQNMFDNQYIHIAGSNFTERYSYVIYDLNNNINTNYNYNKLKVVLKFNNIVNNQANYYYFEVPIQTTQRPGNTTYTKYLWLVDNTKAYLIKANFGLNLNYADVSLYMGVGTLPSIPSNANSEITTILSDVYITDASFTNTEILNDINNAINSLSNVNVDTSDKTAVDNWYDQLEQSLDFPLVDREQLTQGFQKMGKIIKYYGMLINNSEWVLLPKIILISAMFKLFGVIIS